MNLPPMPLRHIKDIVSRENDEYFSTLLASSSPVLLWKDYTNELWLSERDRIMELATYEQVDEWLRNNRGLSLAEWIESL